MRLTGTLKNWVFLFFFSDPQEIKLPLMQAPLHYRKEGDIPTVLSESNKKIQDADAVVLVSPEYNRTAPPALTNFLDHFPPNSYSFKPAAIITYSMGRCRTA